MIRLRSTCSCTYQKDMNCAWYYIGMFREFKPVRITKCSYHTHSFYKL